jgi:type I restriction enzyme R subunit
MPWTRFTRRTNRNGDSRFWPGRCSSASYAERHDNIEAIYKKLEERRDTADVTDLLKELHRIVNEAIRAANPSDGQADAKFFDLSQIDLEKLRDEFSEKVKRKASALQDIRQVVEDKLAQMIASNPLRMDYYKKYSEIVADYNREKDRVTIEDTFAKLVDLANSLSAEQRRAAEEGLSEDELALFDLLKKENLSKADRERVKLASQSLLDSVRKLIAPLERWTEKEQTQAEVEVFILDHVFQALPTPPFTDDEKQAIAKLAYQHIWQQSVEASFAAASGA